MDMKLICNNTARASLTLAGTLLLSSCLPVTDLLIDCIDDDGPVLNPRVLPNPVLNQSYDVRIIASIDNEPFDDSFLYDIVVSRTLPEGLIADIFERQVRISGAATGFNNNGFNGNFNNNNFNGTNSGLCFVSTQRLYRLTVQQGG